MRFAYYFRNLKCRANANISLYFILLKMFVKHDFGNTNGKHNYTR